MKNRKNYIHCMMLVAMVLAVGSLSAQKISVSDAQNGLIVSDDNYSRMTVISNLSEIEYFGVKSKIGDFTMLISEDHGVSMNIGDPGVPVMKKIIEIPLDAEFQINILSESSGEYLLQDYGIKNKIMPTQAPLSKSVDDPDDVEFDYNQETYQINDYLYQERVKVIPVGIMRGVRLARLEVYPVQYNPVQNKIKVFTNIRFEINFTGADVQKTINNKKEYFSPFFESNMSQVINYKPEITDELIMYGPATYVIVSDIMFQSALQPFIQWKTKKGFRVIEGYTNNPSVGNTTTSIKAYLQGLYNNPPAGYNPPSFVLFVGDVAQIPAFSGTAGSHITDLYYCEYTGDKIPECYYGRFSANNLTELQPQIDKTLQYEQYLMPDPSFLNKVVMVAGADASYQTHSNGQINYGTTYYFNAAHGMSSFTYLQPEPSGGNYSANIRQNVSDGVGYANYTAHCSSSGWADPSFVTSHISSLTNANKYPLMVGNCCQSVMFGGTCFGEEILRAANKGALGYIGGSNNTYWNEDYYWGVGYRTSIVLNPVYSASNLGAYDRTFHDHGEPLAQWYITQGQMPSAGNLAVTQSGSSLINYYWEIYHLMGDPSVMIYFSQPPVTTATYASLMPLASTSFNVQTHPYAYVAISKDGMLHGAAVADATGLAVVSLIPINVPGTAHIVVTRQNGQPFTGTVTVASPSGPYLLLNSYSISDNTGNNNGQADYNENILLNVTLENVGSTIATNVSAQITSADAYINITDDSNPWPNIPAGTTSTQTGAFVIHIANNTPDQHTVFLDLEATNGSETWTSNFNFTINAPSLTHSSGIVINDAAGNNNGRLDPGETATITAVVSNNGHSLSPSASALLTSASPYITVNLGSASLGQIAAGSSANAVFEIYCDPATPIGQPVDLAMNVSAGNYGFNHTYFTSVGLVLEDWETGDFSRFPWTFSGNAPWVVTNTGSYEGVYTAKSGTITHNQTSEMSVLLQVTTAGNITFYRKTSSESGYDYLRFYIDGVQLEQWAGETPWGQVSYAVTAGNHTFKWTYYKDGSVNSGSDCVWVDYIVFPPSVILAPEISTNPVMFSKTLSPGGTANDVLNIANTGNIPLDFSAQVVYSGDGKSSITVYPQNLDYRTGTCTSSAKTEVSLVKGYPTTQAGWMTFDVSGIPDGAIINSVEFHGYVNATYYPYWNINPVTSNPLTASAATLYADIIAESSSGYYLYRSESSSYSTGWKVHTLGGNVNTDLQNALAQDWFAIGIMDRDASSTYYIGFDGWAQTNKPYLVIDYTYVPTFTWLKINGGTAVNGSVAAGSNQNINVSFDAGSYPVGTYNANIKITSNDADEGTIFIPCTMVIASGFNLNLTAMLEGPFNGINMNTMINGIIPLNQPYNTTPWNYNGTESVASIPANVVDWVLVELRDATSPANATPATRIARQAGFMMGDGSIVATDGVSPMIFSTAVTNGLYVVLHHRGHLSVMSASALVPVGQVYSHNFSTEQAYGTSAQCLLAPGVYGLRGGDANRDGEISTADMLVIWNMEAGTAGYLMGDFNLDGQVDNKDKDDCWAPNYGLGCQVPE